MCQEGLWQEGLWQEVMWQEGVWRQGSGQMLGCHGGWAVTVDCVCAIGGWLSRWIVCVPIGGWAVTVDCVFAIQLLIR